MAEVESSVFSEPVVRLVIPDQGYSQLLDKAKEASGLSRDTPLMPSFGIAFSVHLEVADFDCSTLVVPGVILPESMVSKDG